MRNLKLTVSYDGTDFNGWQTQPGYRTVQETLEQAIAALTGEPRVRVNASGRTDAGVHAVAQVVNFHTVTHHSADIIVRAVNARLPHDLVVRDACDVAETFDANRDAVRKLYRYVIHDGAVPDVFLRRFCCQARDALDAERMRQAAEPLRGRHDFHSFETEWPNRASSVRTITHLGVSRAWRLDLDRRGGRWLPLQYGARHCRYFDERRPRLLASGAGGKDSQRRGPRPGWADRAGSGVVFDASDVCLTRRRVTPLS